MQHLRGLLRAATLFIAAAAALSTTSHSTSCSSVCGPHGTCVSGTCICASNFTGRFCTKYVQNVPKNAFPAPRSGAFFAVPIQSAGGVAAELLVLDARGGGTQPVLFAHAVAPNGSAPTLPGAPPFGELFRAVWAFDRGSFLTRAPRQVVMLRAARKGGMLYAAVYAASVNHSWWPTRAQPVPNARVRLRVIECGKKRRCRPSVSRPGSWTGSVAVLALPVVLGTMALLTIAMCGRAWGRVLRRAGRGQIQMQHAVSVRDRLAPAETDAMFPRFVFEKTHAVALGAAGEPSCAVCLCGYEEGEMLRRLRCGHSYHMACLDEWLETNASCPRCRKPARIRIVVGSRLLALRVGLARFLRGRHSDERILGDGMNPTTGTGPMV